MALSCLAKECLVSILRVLLVCPSWVCAAYSQLLLEQATLLLR